MRQSSRDLSHSAPMIQTTEALAALVERATQAECIGLDTEFVWEQTYYPALGIVQVALSEEDVFLIDAPAIKDISPLGTVLANPKVVKILHDAPQDLTILRRATGAFPRSVFDARLVAGFVGLSSFISLENLLREALDVRLPKTETRTDWLRRPLSERQIEYAIDDVRHFPALREVLLSGSRDRGRERWVKEELTIYDDPTLYQEPDPWEQFRRVKGAGRLEPRGLAVLRELAAWREEEACKRSSPRMWIVPDEVLMNLAKHRPRNTPELRRIKGLSEQEIEMYGGAMVKAINEGVAMPRDLWPQAEERPKEDEAFGARVDLVLAFMKGKGIDAGIDPALVASRSEITALVREGPEAAPERHHILRGWRREFVGEEILRLLGGKLAVRVDLETGLPRGNHG